MPTLQVPKVAGTKAPQGTGVAETTRRGRMKWWSSYHRRRKSRTRRLIRFLKREPLFSVEILGDVFLLYYDRDMLLAAGVKVKSLLPEGTNLVRLSID